MQTTTMSRKAGRGYLVLVGTLAGWALCATAQATVLLFDEIRFGGTVVPTIQCTG